MNISRFFVDKPIFAAVLSVLVFVAGLISIFVLPISVGGSTEIFLESKIKVD